MSFHSRVAVILPIALVTLAGLIWLWPSGELPDADQPAQGEQTNGHRVGRERALP